MGKVEAAIRQRIAGELQARADECLSAAHNPHIDSLAASALRTQGIVWEAAAHVVSPEAARNRPATASLQAQEAPDDVITEEETPVEHTAPETPPEPPVKVFESRTLPGDRTVYNTKAVRLDQWDIEIARADGWEEYIVVDLERVIYLRRHLAGEPASSDGWTTL
jgi:hypothetical protein